MRLMPASAAASEKVANDRVTPGITSDVVVKLMSSDSKNVASTAAPAALNVLWPDVYDGNGGVAISGVQVGSGSVAPLPSRSPLRIAVTGRQKSNSYFESHALTPASASAMLSSANRRAVSTKVVPRAWTICCAMTFQCPGGVTVPGP